jgi:osmotically-inducible protein OsmY
MPVVTPLARLLAPAALLGALCVAGCSSQQAREAANSLATGAPQVLGDVGIAAQIEARVIRIDADSALHVAISVNGGDVRLSGKVKSESVASGFVAAAKDVSGVKKVDNALSVDANLPPASQRARDAGTIAAVTGDLIAQAGINAFRVKVAAHDGVVTLSGTLKSDAVRQTVVDAAKHAPGVKSVVDRLAVKG